MRRRRPQLGFTLIEALIAVAIVGILTAIAVGSVMRTRERLTAERAMAELRGRIAEAQSLAAIAGPRINTPRLVNNCGGTPNAVEVQVLSPTTISVPTALTPVAPNGLQVDCEVVDLTQLTHGIIPQPPVGNLTSPAVGTLIQFSPTGRVTTLPAAATTLFQFTPTNTPVPFGFRILSSGVMCQSSMPVPPALSLCDENV